MLCVSKLACFFTFQGGRTPLFSALMNAHIEIEKYLVENGADTKHQDKVRGDPI